MNFKNNQKLTNVNIKMKIPVKLKFGVDGKEYESHCFNANFPRAIAALSWNGGHWMGSDDLADDVNHPLLPIEYKGSYSFDYPYDYLQVDNGDYRGGILLGTGTSANLFTSVYPETGLESRINNGSDAGQLTYLANQLDSAIQVTSGKIFYKVSKTVQNDTGSIITVNEMAFNCGMADGQFNSLIKNRTNQLYTIARDVFPSPVDIAPGESKTFFFSFTVEQLAGGSYPLSKWFYEGIKRAMLRDVESDGSYDRNKNHFNISGVLASDNTDPVAHSPSTDVSLIPEGKGDGELHYITAPVKGREVYFEFTDRAELRFDQFVWNYGLSDITVKKLYLRSNSYILGGALLPTEDYFAISAGGGAKLNLTLEISL